MRTRTGEDLLDTYDVVDLTHPLGPETPLWPGSSPVTVERVAGYGEGYYANRLALPEHAGTHVDSPAHVIEGAVPVDRIAASDLVAPAAVIDVSAACARDPDYLLSRDDVDRFERENGPIPRRAIVIVSTGWEARWGDAARCRNEDAAGRMHFPGFSAEAVRFLIDERDIVGVGIDTLSTDRGISEGFEVHHALHGAGRFGIEGLANLARLPPLGAFVVVGVLPIAGGSGAPARVLALVPRG